MNSLMTTHIVCAPAEGCWILLTSSVLLLACVRQDCMLPLLEVLPFSSSMLDRGRRSSSVLDLCACCWPAGQL